jgi:hypothetical protein
MLGHLDTFFVDKYQGTDLGLNKTNRATTVSVNTIESMSIAVITTNIPQGIIYLPNIDVLYTNEITKQFAFISKSTTFKDKIKLITNDKQLMMRTIKRVINKKVLRIEELKKTTIRQNSTLTDTYLILYDNTIEKLYQIYNTVNEKIKSL